MSYWRGELMKVLARVKALEDGVMTTILDMAGFNIVNAPNVVSNTKVTVFTSSGTFTTDPKMIECEVTAWGGGGQVEGQAIRVLVSWLLEAEAAAVRRPMNASQPRRLAHHKPLPSALAVRVLLLLRVEREAIRPWVLSLRREVAQEAQQEGLQQQILQRLAAMAAHRPARLSTGPVSGGNSDWR